MSNHKWKDNVCVNCGIRREKKEYKRWKSCGTYLSRNGIWEERTHYDYGIKWHYGAEHKFIRPNCETKK